MKKRKPLRFLIASGPTQEPLDPVRYISNYSTGTMGRYLAEAARRRGHHVTWVRCPADAQTARDLKKILSRQLPSQDVLVMAAAVCDVRPARVSAGKVKKSDLSSVRFVKNPDLLRDLGKKKKRGQVFAGFALESGRLVESGRAKMKSKKLEVILVQRVTKKIVPFGNNKLEAVLLRRRGDSERFRALSKPRAAQLVIRESEIAAEAAKRQVSA